MAWFLFIDESGHDRLASPYEVLAGVATRDHVLRGLIARLHDAEVASFGCRYSDGRRELKGSVLLKRKVFCHGALNAELDLADRPTLAHAALNDGVRANARMLKAFALAKLDYVATVFDICTQFGCRAFASIVEIDAQPTAGRGLRKDYAYLFERFFYFLEDNAADEQGIVVFDELEKSKSHLLIHQMHRYFEETAGEPLPSALFQGPRKSASPYERHAVDLVRPPALGPLRAGWPPANRATGEGGMTASARSPRRERSDRSGERATPLRVNSKPDTLRALKPDTSICPQQS